MPNGAANVTSNVYEIDQTDRHSAGHYVCTAENHVGFTDSKEIFVNVRCEYNLFPHARLTTIYSVKSPSHLDIIGNELARIFDTQQLHPQKLF